jgi:hypothetical protein
MNVLTMCYNKRKQITLLGHTLESVPEQVELTIFVSDTSAERH